MKIYLEKEIQVTKILRKEFKLLIVVLTDKSLSEDEWTTVDNTAEWFSRKGDDGTYLYNFWEATGGVGTISIEN